jgi:hypothetical protein
MRIKLKKDQVIAGSVWLKDSELTLPADEARKLIEAGEAEAVSPAGEAGKGKTKKTKEEATDE